MTDPDEYVAAMMHGLISNVQENAVREADARYLEDRRKLLELRRSEGLTGVSISELLRQLSDDDPVRKQQAVTAEMDRVEKEAAAAVAAKEKTDEQLPQNQFPPPVITSH